jgi:hypothetical protein
MPSRLVYAFSALFVVIGVALLAETARAGGGMGYLLGGLFVALGLGRAYIQRERRARR